VTDHPKKGFDPTTKRFRPMQYKIRKRPTQAPSSPQHTVMTRAVYDALPKTERKLVDYARRSFAEAAAKTIGMPFEVVLQSITAAHERGHFKLVLGGKSGITLQNGELLPGGWDWDAAS
jgi:hypothetical protein